MFNLIVFHVLLLCINKMSIFMGMFHMVNMVIGVIKSYQVHFFTRKSNCSLRRDYFLCIFFNWSPLAVIHVCDCSEGIFIWVPLHLCKMVLWRENYLEFHHVALIFISHLCCWIQNQYNFLSGVVLKMLTWARCSSRSEERRAHVNC